MHGNSWGPVFWLGGLDVKGGGRGDGWTGARKEINNLSFWGVNGAIELSTGGGLGPGELLRS